MHPGRKIFLIGFMGSGKSTLGRKLASHLGWKFIDLDEKIEGQTGMKIPEIFSSKGEFWFREKESELLHTLAGKTDIVVSTGGGAPCYADNIDFMNEEGLTVYLRLTPQQLEYRLKKSKTERPLIKNIEEKDLLNYIVEKLAEREKWYSQAAVIIDGIDNEDSYIISLINGSNQE